MHDPDHSKEHVRAAVKTGDGPETNKLDAQSVVQREADSIARQQGGAGNGLDFGSVVEKTAEANASVKSDKVEEGPTYDYGGLY